MITYFPKTATAGPVIRCGTAFIRPVVQPMAYLQCYDDTYMIYDSFLTCLCESLI